MSLDGLDLNDYADRSGNRGRRGASWEARHRATVGAENADEALTTYRNAVLTAEEEWVRLLNSGAGELPVAVLRLREAHRALTAAARALDTAGAELVGAVAELEVVGAEAVPHTVRVRARAENLIGDGGTYDPDDPTRGGPATVAARTLETEHLDKLSDLRAILGRL